MLLLFRDLFFKKQRFFYHTLSEVRPLLIRHHVLWGNIARGVNLKPYDWRCKQLSGKSQIVLFFSITYPQNRRFPSRLRRSRWPCRSGPSPGSQGPVLAGSLWSLLSWCNRCLITVQHYKTNRCQCTSIRRNKVIRSNPISYLI